VGALTEGAIDRPTDGEDDVTLFLWLVEELERFEVQPEASRDTSPEAAERRRRALRNSAAAVAARLDED